ncbi:hypothetical protein LOAG_10091 [Loa loa]|uniref:DUF3707 domain-containing protein n=1 Tax=Loa loa TaxID=7209 RepID=A0A1I7W0L9_LOALO|nr:hypothetical protein LOAG_10091 [Loa loa]EFO18403.1 hypothetical protein LOAG_10091 [Loa loa]
MQLPVAYSCAATPPIATPTPIPTRPPTSAPAPTSTRPATPTSTRPPTPIPDPICCQPLLASPTNNTNLSNGIMSFTYSSNTCRSLAIATCTQPTIAPALQLMAGITVNQVNFVNIQSTTVSIPLVCNKARQWETAEPPLVVATIQCVLSTL